MLGALCHYVTHADPRDFQPMKANFGLFHPPQDKISKRERGHWYAEKALTRMRRFTREFAVAYDRRAAEKDLLDTAVL
jgi:methylenetetrahydrofolate--tRNA-(uracil-5-)-methyltransferase